MGRGGVGESIYRGADWLPSAGMGKFAGEQGGGRPWEGWSG